MEHLEVQNKSVCTSGLHMLVNRVRRQECRMKIMIDPALVGPDRIAGLPDIPVWTFIYVQTGNTISLLR